MTFEETLDQAIAMLQRRGRVTYSTLKRQFQEEHDDHRTIRAKVSGQVLTLDEALQETTLALLAILDALPADSPFLRLDPPQRRQRTLEGLKRLLLRESQVQPLVLVFEDLHWIDAETQALLDSLVESLPTARLLLLVNYRPEYQHTWGHKTYYAQLRLDPLSPASTDELLQALLGGDVSLAPLTALLSARTAGNPFFLEESVRTLVEAAVLTGTPGAYRLTHRLEHLQMPTTVQVVLAARIDRLPPEVKRLLQTAAVIGTEVPLPLLQAIADAPPETLYRHLAHLQAAEFLYETRLFPEREYTFKHALTHEVAYSSLLQERRRALAMARSQKECGYESYALRLIGTIVASGHPPSVEQAALSLQQALTLTAELGMRPLQAHCHHTLGSLYAQTSQNGLARVSLGAAITMYREMDMTFWLPQAEATLAPVEGRE
jgi:predicted ATPase